jgi:dihydroflavonol-4-reductase
VRVLVTGATGFTGGHLARYLQARGAAVRVLVRDPQRAADLHAAGIEVAIGDLLARDTVASAMANREVVYNIAALYREAGLREQAYYAVNAHAVGSLVEAAGRAGVRRVVHCSTVGVHGDVGATPVNEDAPFDPGDVYQRAKVLGETIAREAASRSGVELVIARPTGIYGPGDRRLLKLFRGVARGRFVLVGDGRISYHLTYVGDLVEGLRLSGEMPAAAGRIYILGGPEIPTLNEIIRAIAEEAHVRVPRVRLPVWPVWLAGAVCEALCYPLRLEPPIYRRRVDFFTKSRAFEINRARREIGFAPQIGVREGVRLTLAWYREHGWL